MERAVSREADGDIKSAKKLRLHWWGILLVMCAALPTFWLFDQWGLLNMALPMFDCVAGFALVLYVKRDRFAEPWFWITIAILAAAHASAIFYIPWTDSHITAAAATAVVSLDLCLMLWILAVVDIWLHKRPAA